MAKICEGQSADELQRSKQHNAGSARVSRVGFGVIAKTIFPCE
jgi:hypothetical protein